MNLTWQNVLKKNLRHDAVSISLWHNRRHARKIAKIVCWMKSCVSCSSLKNNNNEHYAIISIPEVDGDSLSY